MRPQRWSKKKTYEAPKNEIQNQNSLENIETKTKSYEAPHPDPDAELNPRNHRNRIVLGSRNICV